MKSKGQDRLPADFKPDDVIRLLVACHRRCCICHRFCGVKMEIDHIIPREEGGTGEYENAIAVCFECHAEIHSYNDKHPRGRKFRPEELKKHRNQWLDTCKSQPEALLAPSRTREVGPIQAMVDELEFNIRALALSSRYPGCPLEDRQFHRAVAEGSIAILVDGMKLAAYDAYIAVGRYNAILSTYNSIVYRTDASSVTIIDVLARTTQSVRDQLIHAHSALLRYLGREGEFALGAERNGITPPLTDG